jgi:hypothetical protein
MDGFSETAREHNSGRRPAPSKLWVLVAVKADVFEIAGEYDGSELFNGADEQDARMKISKIVEYLIFPVYFPIGSPSPESVSYLIRRPLSISENDFVPANCTRDKGRILLVAFPFLNDILEIVRQ